jgi:hypothetical protein
VLCNNAHALLLAHLGNAPAASYSPLHTPAALVCVASCERRSALDLPCIVPCRVVLTSSSRPSLWVMHASSASVSWNPVPLQPLPLRPLHPGLSCLGTAACSGGWCGAVAGLRQVRIPGGAGQASRYRWRLRIVWHPPPPFAHHFVCTEIGWACVVPAVLQGESPGSNAMHHADVSGGVLLWSAAGSPASSLAGCTVSPVAGSVLLCVSVT